MKELESRPQQEAQLTRNMPSPRLEEGTIFMGNTTTVETSTETKKETKIEAKQSPLKENVSRRIRERWYKKYGEKEIAKNPNLRSTIELLVKRGIPPKEEAMTENEKKEIQRIVADMQKEEEQRRKRVEVNAGIESDEERIERAKEYFRQAFKKELTDEQAKAVIEAHRVGKGKEGEEPEIGRDGERQAGVFNYTDKQLFEKVRILKDADLSEEERDALIEEGYAGATVAPPDRPAADGQEATTERARSEEVAQRLAGTPLESLSRDVLGLWDSQNLSEEQIEALLTDARNTAGADVAQREAFSELMKQARAAINKREGEIREVDNREHRRSDKGTFFKLRESDFVLLIDPENPDDVTSIDKWVNQKFDTLYEASHGRDPASSPVLEEMNAAYGEAVRYVENRPEKVQRLADLFESRIRLMTMNSAISSKSIESIQKASYGLRAHGLLAGYDLDYGYTGALANRMAELLEDERLKATRGHMTPELANKIQDMMEEETKKLRDQGIGIHATRMDGQRRSDSDILRAVRSAYDIVVDTQRMHILAARGKQLLGTDAYFSDAGAAFKSFNPKTFVSEKWGLLTPTDVRFAREVIETRLVDDWLEDHTKKYPEVKLDEDQKRELGEILFKTIAAPPDFFSSSWRIKGMKDQLHNLFEYKEYERIAHGEGRDINSLTPTDWSILKKNNPFSEPTQRRIKEKEEQFGLFIRLKSAKDEEKPEVWDRIISYRPEEIIRLLREKYSEEEMQTVNRDIFGGMNTVDENGQTIVINGYDSFKEKFGGTIRAIREKYFASEDPEQLDFAHLTDAQRQEIDTMIGATQRQIIERAFQNMQRYVKGNNVVYTEQNRAKVAQGSVIDKDYRFTDVYNKTLATDDILLADLEMLKKPQLESGMRKLSDLWSSDLGGDGFVRNMNDLAAGHRYTDSMIGFMRAKETEEKLKMAQEAATAASDYDGRLGMAKVLNSSVVPYMWAAMPPDVMDVLGIDKLPMRLKMTLLEKIYGPHAHPISQEKRREEFDKIESLLESSVQTDIDELLDEINKVKNDPEKSEIVKSKEIADLKEKIEKKHHAGHKLKEHAEKVLKIRGRDLALQKIGQLAFYAFVLAVLGEGVLVFTSAASASASELGSGGGGGGHH